MGEKPIEYTYQKPDNSRQLKYFIYRFFFFIVQGYIPFSLCYKM